MNESQTAGDVFIQYVTHCCLVGFDMVLRTTVVVIVLRYFGVIDV